MSKPKRIVIHRGPIPGTDIGHHWFEAAGGERFGIRGWPHGINHGWSYEIIDIDDQEVDDGMYRFDEIREWASKDWSV